MTLNHDAATAMQADTSLYAGGDKVHGKDGSEPPRPT